MKNCTIFAGRSKEGVPEYHNKIRVYLVLYGKAVNNAVNKYEGKLLEDGTGKGQATWKALAETYSSHTKEARRGVHDKLVQGLRPSLFIVLMTRGRRGCLADSS